MNNSIAKLETILNEFYHQSTSNFRKKEIEKDLKVIQDSPENLQIFLEFLSSVNSVNNQFLWFFSVSTIEVRRYNLV